MAAPLLREHTDAVVAALRDSAGISSVGEVGDGDAEGLNAPYWVVYRIPGGSSSGELADPQGDAEFIYQISCVGISREQTEWMADKATEVLFGGLVVAGRSVFMDIEDHPGVRADHDISPSVFVATPRYRIYTTPGGG
jgi:hypothetical protein